MRVLITGGPGFIGGALAAKLHTQNGFEVYIPARAEMDITDREIVSQTMSDVRPDWIFHLAADTSKDKTSSQKMDEVNIGGTINLLEAAKENGVKAFVAAGSFSEYGAVPTPYREDGPAQPYLPYGRSKAAATKIVIDWGKRGLPATVLRFSNVYGSGMSDQPFIGKVMKAACGGPKVPTSPTAMRDFIHVDDCIAAFITGAEKIDNCRGEVINICSGSEVSMIEVTRIAERFLERSISIIAEVPEGAALLSNRGSNEKARRLLGWRPQIRLEDGIRELLESVPKKQTA